jgi:hypothetical protein
MIKRRNRTKQTRTLEERLASDSKLARELAKKLPPGPEWEAMLKRVRRNDVAAKMTLWLSSPGLRAPT